MKMKNILTFLWVDLNSLNKFSVKSVGGVHEQTTDFKSSSLSLSLLFVLHNHIDFSLFISQMASPRFAPFPNGWQLLKKKKKNPALFCLLKSSESSGAQLRFPVGSKSFYQRGQVEGYSWWIARLLAATHGVHHRRWMTSRTRAQRSSTQLLH